MFLSVCLVLFPPVLPLPRKRLQTALCFLQVVCSRVAIVSLPVVEALDVSSLSMSLSSFFFTLVVVVCLSCHFSASLWLSFVSRGHFLFLCGHFVSLKTFLVFYSPSRGSSASIPGPLIDFLTKRYL